MISLEPIGVVQNNVSAPKRQGWASVESRIVLNEEYAEALTGIETFSHALIIFWIDRAPKLESLTRHVNNREELPIIGVFAGRTPQRPNPIGISAVPVIGREGNVLTVGRLDAIDNTPVLDIKPYTPAFDRVESPTVPDWSNLLYEVEDYF